MDEETTGYDSKKVIDELMMKIGGDIIKIAYNIVDNAKRICDDPDCKKIKVKSITFDGKTFNMELDFIDNTAKDCMIKAIQEVLHTLPSGIKDIFQAQITRLQSMK